MPTSTASIPTDMTPKKDLAWILVLYLLGVIGSMIVAGLWFF